MQDFLQRILKLNEEEEIEKTMTPLERGILIHRILFKFFMQLKSQKQHNQPWNHFDILNRSWIPLKNRILLRSQYW